MLLCRDQGLFFAWKCAYVHAHASGKMRKVSQVLSPVCIIVRGTADLQSNIQPDEYLTLICRCDLCMFIHEGWGLCVCVWGGGGWGVGASMCVCTSCMPAAHVLPVVLQTVLGSCKLFSALLTRCLDRGVMAMCQFSPTANAVPRIVALMPQVRYFKEFPLCHYPWIVSLMLCYIIS